MAKRPELEIENGPLAGHRYAVGAEGLRLGRSSSNDIHIPDAELSRNHCLFEAVGEDGLRVTDLASANGTLVNGTLVENEPVPLAIGDRIEVGITRLKVVANRSAPQESVDLGLDRGPADGEAPAPKRRKRSPFANVLWAFVVLAVSGTAYVLLVDPVATKKATAETVASLDEDPPVREVYYEKVEADGERIFRYELTLSEAGNLRVAVDDLPKDARHLAKEKILDGKSVAVLNEILAYKALRELEREYVGAESEPPVLNSVTLKVVYADRVHGVKVVNRAEPDALKVIRERLETFSKNELGVWALQYSREKLVELAENAFALGQSKWEEREVNYGNLHAAALAFREALFYLETVNPKPDCEKKATQGLANAQKELERRLADQRFRADQAINLQKWEDAQRELQILVEMIPERNDDRNREARRKLIDVEKRLQKGDK